MTRTRRTAGPSPSSNPRHRAGRRAELAVIDYLTAQGFSILHTNLRLGHLEIDVVARQGDLVVIVEVRTRGPGAFERPLASIGRDKRERLVRAAERLWRDRLRFMEGVERVRLDVAAVEFDPGGGASVEYIAGALSG